MPLTLTRDGYLGFPKPKLNETNVHLIFNGVSSAIAKGIWDDIDR